MKRIICPWGDILSFLHWTTSSEYKSDLVAQQYFTFSTKKTINGPDIVSERVPSEQFPQLHHSVPTADKYKQIHSQLSRGAQTQQQETLVNLKVHIFNLKAFTKENLKLFSSCWFCTLNVRHQIHSSHLEHAVRHVWLGGKQEVSSLEEIAFKWP